MLRVKVAPKEGRKNRKEQKKSTSFITRLISGRMMSNECNVW